MKSKEIRAKGRQAFKANYWPCVLAAFLLALLLGGASASGGGSAANTTQSANSGAEAWNSLPEEVKQSVTAGVLAALGTISLVGVLLKIFVFNPLQVGCFRFFQKNAENPPAPLGIIKEGFGGYGHTLLTLFLRDLFLCLWALLFVIPGIIKAYSYRLVPYIIKDEPELSAMETIRRSKELMKGNKWRAFKLDLSFLGWILLGIVTFGLALVFWTNPYRESSYAVFYNELKKNA